MTILEKLHSAAADPDSWDWDFTGLIGDSASVIEELIAACESLLEVFCNRCFDENDCQTCDRNCACICHESDKLSTSALKKAKGEAP